MSWSEIRIGDIGEVITGNTPPKKRPELYGSTYKFIKPTDMEIGNRYTPETEDGYSQEGYELYQKSLIPALSTCVVTIGSIGKKMTLTEEDCFVNQAVNAVVPNKKLYDPYFVFYALKNILPKVKAADTGASSGRENVSKSNFSGLKLEVPSDLPTQRKIASILSAYDDLIENNLKRIKLLEEAAQNIYREWFVHFRYPGHEGVEIDAETGLPAGWGKVKLKDLIIIPKDRVNPRDISKDTPYIGLEHMPRKSITLAEWETAEKVDSLKSKFEKGDIIFGKIRPYFHKVGFSLVEGIASTDAIIMRPRKMEYFGLVLMTVSSVDFVDHATQTSNGTKMPRANWNILQNYQIPFPNETLLFEFNNFVKLTVKQLETLATQNQKLKEARDILLPRLMNRTIEV